MADAKGERRRGSTCSNLNLLWTLSSYACCSSALASQAIHFGLARKLATHVSTRKFWDPQVSWTWLGSWWWQIQRLSQQGWKCQPQRCLKVFRCGVPMVPCCNPMLLVLERWLCRQSAMVAIRFQWIASEPKQDMCLRTNFPLCTKLFPWMLSLLKFQCEIMSHVAHLDKPTGRNPTNLHQNDCTPTGNAPKWLWIPRYVNPSVSLRAWHLRGPPWTCFQFWLVCGQIEIANNLREKECDYSQEVWLARQQALTASILFEL